MGWWVFLLRNLNGGVKFLESNCYGREQSHFKLCMSELVVIRPASNNKMECPRVCLSDKNMHSEFQTTGRGSGVHSFWYGMGGHFSNKGCNKYVISSGKFINSHLIRLTENVHEFS